MTAKPSLSLLDGADWRRAVEAEAEAQEAGTLFELPALEERLAAGATVKLFDRSNAVFYMGLFDASAGSDLSDLEPLADAPRSMYILAGLQDMEAKLSGNFVERGGVVLTGAPDEQDGLENFLHYQGVTAWLSKEGESFQISLRGVDYTQLNELLGTSGYHVDDPKPELNEVFAAPTLKAAYIAAASFGELARERRYLAKGLEAPPLRSPVILPDLAPDGPRSRPSGLAQEL
jgi:hypothetical protein